MVKFRQNHQKNKGSGSVLKFVIYALVLLAMLWYGLQKMQAYQSLPNTNKKAKNNSDKFYLPQGMNGEVIHHTAYSLSYVEEHEQAEWVAYKISKELLNIPNVKRTNDYQPDKAVSTKSAVHSDYTRSGYTRGHLAPAGDMAHTTETMQESFYMSNMSPQKHAFNNGIWKELEENIRDWAYKKGELIIVTGPILNDIIKKIGKNRVSVPSFFYKVIFDESNEDMVGFIIPNEVSEKHLEEYMVTIDEIEKQTGIDFFNNYLNDDLEEELESRITKTNWKFSSGKYEQRIYSWNKQ
jgi:endonuclease G